MCYSLAVLLCEVLRLQLSLATKSLPMDSILDVKEQEGRSVTGWNIRTFNQHLFPKHSSNGGGWEVISDNWTWVKDPFLILL